MEIKKSRFLSNILTYTILSTQMQNCIYNLMVKYIWNHVCHKVKLTGNNVLVSVLLDVVLLFCRLGGEGLLHTIPGRLDFQSLKDMKGNWIQLHGISIHTQRFSHKPVNVGELFLPLNVDSNKEKNTVSQCVFREVEVQLVPIWF